MNISWYVAVEFCNWLSEQAGYEPSYTLDKEHKDPNNFCEYDGRSLIVHCDFNKKGFRLPTEAEWEFAARGGNKGSQTLYAGSNNADEVAWYVENAGEVTDDIFFIETYFPEGYKDEEARLTNWEMEINPQGPYEGTGCWFLVSGIFQ